MKARSTALAQANGPRVKAEPRPKRAGGRKRLPFAERRALILAQAEGFFSEYGLTAQTRALAYACGTSHRLLYRFFPTKADLLDKVYEDAILAPFKAVWIDQLTDRSRPVEERLVAFYRDYFSVVLTRKWLRLFLYSSLAESRMAPDYIDAIIKRLIQTVAEEVAAEQGLNLPDDTALIHEIAWTLHGTISHFAIRKHLYHASQTVPEETVISLHVRSFLSGFRAMVLEHQGSPRELTGKGHQPTITPNLFPQ
jgi:AcrR family transcriptional regulator